MIRLYPSVGLHLSLSLSDVIDFLLYSYSEFERRRCGLHILLVGEGCHLSDHSPTLSEFPLPHHTFFILKN